MGVRARSTLIGMAVALLVLALAVASILARHRDDPARPEIRVRTGR
jgi:hypothetical protein